GRMAAPPFLQKFEKAVSREAAFLFDFPFSHNYRFNPAEQNLASAVSPGHKPSGQQLLLFYPLASRSNNE
ncbi:hypothetical protein, partial [Microbulbifer taiwanensis]|uniref:hypothetical protein n=1 Tax=Microbulbifer taiwanensis TaxID=986746 RepID=UPI001D014024